MVLWTRVTGDGLPRRLEVTWQVAADERFDRIVAGGSETADAADAHSVHAEPAGLEPARWYWYRFTALGQQSRVGRTRTAPAAAAAVATLRFAIASCQRYDSGHYAAWRHIAEQDLDLVVFLGDYIYETPSRARFDPPPRGRSGAHAGAVPRPATPPTRATRCCRRRMQQRHGSWCGTTTRCPTTTPTCSNQRLDTDFAARRAAAYRAYWEHMPFRQSQRDRSDADMRIYGHVDWGRLARFHLLDDRQYRDPQACPRPGRGGSNTVRRSD